MELEDTKEYYRQQQENLDNEFEKSVREKIDVLVEFPLMYPKISEKLHKIVMYRFPYHIFYYVAEDIVTIVSIAHQHRKPFYTV